jgi:hypothetical protein
MRKGLEYEGVANLVPGAQSIPVKTPRGVANAGSGGKGTDGTPAKASQAWAVVDSGVTHNDAGAGITVKDLATVNADTNGLAYSFPGASADDNCWIVQWQVPSNYDPAKPITMTLEVLAE